MNGNNRNVFLEFDDFGGERELTIMSLDPIDLTLSIKPNDADLMKLRDQLNQAYSDAYLPDDPSKFREITGDDVREGDWVVFDWVPVFVKGDPIRVYGWLFSDSGFYRCSCGNGAYGVCSYNGDPVNNSVKNLKIYRLIGDDDERN